MPFNKGLQVWTWTRSICQKEIHPSKTAIFGKQLFLNPSFFGGGGNKSQYLVGWGLVTLQGTLPKCAIVNVLQAEENTCSEYIEQNTKSLIYTTVHIAVQASRRQFNLLNNSRSSKNAVINRTVVPWYLRSLLPYKECRENPDHCSVHSSQTTYPGSSLPVLAYRRMNFNWGSIHPNLEPQNPWKM